MFRRFNLDAVKHQVLNDFRWLSSASPLLDQHPTCLPLIHDVAKAIFERRFDVSDDQWAALIVIRNGPLGRYFETLIGTVLSVSPDIEEAHFNVPVREGGSTKGEFDVLYKRQGTWHHLEMAIKYYIGVGDRTDPYNWHGPALRDNLGRKWHHMMSRQLRLADTRAAQHVLDKFDISELIREPMIMGRLFHPYHDWENSCFSVPAGISESHSKGWWTRSSESIVTSATCWKQLSKAEWLSSASGLLNDSFSEPSLVDPEHPTQFAVLEPSTAAEFKETCRGFIVPDDWGMTLPSGDLKTRSV